MHRSAGTTSTTLTAVRRALASALVATGMLVATAGPAAAADEGEVNFELSAGSWFDSYITSATSSQKTWMNEHYSRMRGFAPFFTQALSWAPEATFYQDIYALYRNDPPDEQVMQQHPDWVLRDAQGRKLFIQFACDGTSCTQYAADIGNPEFRQFWIQRAANIMDDGYDGLYVDDVNMEMKVSDGTGTFTRPVDPRTGQPMTDTNWRRYMAEFTEEIRAAFPDKEITHNSLWWMDHNDPYVQRQTDAADYIEIERGFNDGGIGGGTGTFSYSNYLSHMDWVHSRGAGIISEPYNVNTTSATFEIASYLLVSNGNDYVSSDYRATHSNWWSGWDTDIGDAAGARYSWQGLRRRDFSGGMALTNDPGAPTRTVQLPTDATYKDMSGNTVTSVTLGARQGIVLTKTANTTSGGGTDTTGGTGGTTSGGGTTTPAPTPSPAPSPAPSGSGGSAPSAPATGTQPSGGSSTGTSTQAPTIEVNRTKVKHGRKVRVTGRANASRVEIRAWIDGEWQLVSSDDSVEDGAYKAKLRTTTPGVLDLKATAPGAGESSTVTIRIK
jgi:hypothetical protein